MFCKETKLEILKKLEKANIAFANLNSVEALSSHRLLRNKELHFADTSVFVADLPLASDVKTNTVVPSLNQHGNLLRNEFKIK